MSRTQASDASGRLPRYMRRSVWNARASNGGGLAHLRVDIKGTELPPANILIPLERQLTALQLCRWQFLDDPL